MSASAPMSVEASSADASGQEWLRAALRSLRPGLKGFLRVLRANPLTLLGFAMVVVIVILALLIAFLPAVSQGLLGHPVSILPYDPAYYPSPCPGPIVNNATVCALPPSSQHILGTDNLGRDMFSRVLAALPLDLAIGFSVTLFALLLGGSLGLVAGYWDRPGTIGGAFSVIILRLADVFLAFPSLVLALAIAATLGRDLVPSLLAILFTWWPYYVRLVRGEVLVVKQQPYIIAAKAAGVSDVRILMRHVIRNIIEPVMVYFTLDVGTVVVTFSTISFIGVGVKLGVLEWGNMVEGYQEFLTSFPWTVLSAGAAIFVTVLAFGLLGDGLRDILDPRSRRALAQAAVPTTLAASAIPTEA
jgi:peptide/nickel transport system permease protein